MCPEPRNHQTTTKVSPDDGAVVRAVNVRVFEDAVLAVISVACFRKAAVVVSEAKMIVFPLN